VPVSVVAFQQYFCDEKQVMENLYCDLQGCPLLSSTVKGFRTVKSLALLTADKRKEMGCSFAQNEEK
jgi:hypothetical protein